MCNAREFDTILSDDLRTLTSDTETCLDSFDGISLIHLVVFKTTWSIILRLLSIQLFISSSCSSIRIDKLIKGNWMQLLCMWSTIKLPTESEWEVIHLVRISRRRRLQNESFFFFLLINHKLAGHTQTFYLLPSSYEIISERIWMEAFGDEQYNRIHAYWLSTESHTRTRSFVISVYMWDPEVFHSIVICIRILR